ncbi:hypothetical protein CF328_g6839 [Tilletia controversa]|nr:hypothetical protein CF328_g6839 [Tilletia controversa]
MSSSVDPPHSYLFQLSFVTGLTGFYLWIGTFKFLDVNLHQERWICVPIGSDKFYATCFLGFCIFFDTIIAALIVSKLYRTSKEIDVPLLSIVFRDAWVFGVVSMAPGVASLLTMHLGGRAAAMVVCMPLHLVIDVLLASYAYRATFQAGTKMLPAGSKSENMVLNGEILNAEELRQLAFRMGSAVATGEEFHRYGASASDPCSREHAYLPGKLSRVQHDPLPPFSTYTYPPSRLSLQGRHNPTALGLLGGPQSPQTKLSATYLLQMALVSMQIGIWIWVNILRNAGLPPYVLGLTPLFLTSALKEYLNTFSLDYKLITGKRPLRVQGVIYLTIRVCLTVFVLTILIYKQGFSRINCRAIWRTSNVFSTVGYTGSRLIFLLRAMAVLTLCKLYNVSKRSHLRLLHVVVRDAWVFSALSIIPTVSSIVLLSVKNYIAIFELVPLDNFLHVILASRAYAAIFESGLTMLPHEEQVVKKVVNGDIMDQQARNRLAFKMNDRSTATTGDSSGSHRFEGRMGEDRYLPGAMSRETQDPTPPFAAYLSNNSATVVLAHEEDPDRKSGSHDEDRGFEVPTQAHSSSTGEDQVKETVLDSSQLSPIRTPPSVLHHRQVQRAPPSAAVTSSPSLPRITFSASPTTAPETPQRHGTRNKLFGKRLREAQSLSQLDTTGANARGCGPRDDEPPHSAGGVVRHSSSPMNVRVGVDVDVRVDRKEIYPLPRIFQNLRQDESAPAGSAGTSLGSTDNSEKDEEKTSGSLKRKMSFASVLSISHGRSSRGGISGGPSPRHRPSFLRHMAEHGTDTGAGSVDGSCAASQSE